MKLKENSKALLIFSLILSIGLFSCRKKEEKYEGNYSGTETHTKKDSGAATFSLDTTYAQEAAITYSKKIYTFNKLMNGPHQVFTIDSKSIVAGEHYPFSEVYTDGQGDVIASGGYLQFSNDSMYLNMTTSINYNEESFKFAGKRN